MASWGCLCRIDDTELNLRNLVMERIFKAGLSGLGLGRVGGEGWGWAWGMGLFGLGR